MKVRPLILTDPARADLAAIRDDMAVFSTSGSARYARLFANAFERLREFPAIGRTVPERSGLRLWIVHPYIVVYTEHTRGLVVLRVVHGARDLDLILDER